MDINTLAALGINKEEITERIIDRAVNELLTSKGFDPDSELEVSYESRFKKEIEARIKKSVDAKIAALAEIHLIPRVGEMIEKADMRQTNRFGEPTSSPMTFKEYIAQRAESYMSEDVNVNGQSKQEADNAYGWSSAGPRLTVLMRSYIRQTLENNAKAALTDVNKVIADGIQKAAVDAIANAANSLKVIVTNK